VHDPPLVLVVDDTANVRELIRVNLVLEGFDVRTATDGQEALDLVAELVPDLITMDVVMPRLDGLAAATRLKADPATAGIPIVMVTARAQTADRDKGRQGRRRRVPHQAVRAGRARRDRTQSAGRPPIALRA
jgi:CheY-like chemotaxis protein